MNKVLKIIGIVFAILVVLMVAAVIIIPRLDLPEAVSIEVGSIDLTTVDNGTYHGSCDAGLVKVDLTVEVADHQITSIVIDKHDNGMGKKAETIIDTIMDQQSIDVDAVSGATISSDAIRKAVEEAIPCE